MEPVSGNGYCFIMAATPHILIVGAGIGGLTTALALIRRGIDVDVYEAMPELRELGAGLQLSANGTRVLTHLGLGAAMDQIVCPAAGKEVRIWNTGQRWKLFDLGEDSVRRFNSPYWFTHRGDFYRVLLDAVQAAKPGAVHRNKTATSYRNTPTGVTLDFADGTSVTGDAAIGADGIHSALRHQMVGAGKPDFVGIISWRGLVPIERLPEDLRRPVGTNWVGPGGHVITYPVRRGELLNFVGFAERDDWRVESWTERGTVEECAADFVGWHDHVETIVRNVDAPFKWALLAREPLERMADGRVCLTGDACHPMLPFLAQGANQALEDAVVMARCIEAFADDILQAFKRFEALRGPRTSTIVRGSAENARRFHNPTLADSTAAAAYVDREWQPERIRKRYDWLFEYDAVNVPLDPVDESTAQAVRAHGRDQVVGA
jgi:salicylate hydroxylase